jgi:hypothetical protein
MYTPQAIRISANRRVPECPLPPTIIGAVTLICLYCRFHSRTTHWWANHPLHLLYVLGLPTRVDVVFSKPITTKLRKSAKFIVDMPPIVACRIGSDRQIHLSPEVRVGSILREVPS